ncbi:MAG: hypothetical protein QM770_17800 [Tepidisphaeraceae bacterium]
MPTLQLHDSTAHPDGWHHVRLPGGYEWWYFDAEDPTTDTQVVALFMEGFIFHPGYLRAHRRFERSPTRHRPPIAGDYPCVYLCVYRSGRLLHQFFTQYRPEQFRAASDRADVQIGPNSLMTTETGYALELTGTPWKLTGRGPITMSDRTLSASLEFRSRVRHAPIERTFLSSEMTGADHRWAIAAPACDVAGTISVTGAMSESITFTGRGYHDHNFGTAPIGRGLKRWTWGRALFSDRVLTFHYAEPRDSRLSPEVHLVEVDASGTPRDIASPRVTGDFTARCKPAMMLVYPPLLAFGDELTLSNPRVIDPSPFYLRLMFDAESRGEGSTAFCEIAYPHRLRWPILGRMIEMSFDKRSLNR